MSEARAPFRAKQFAAARLTGKQNKAFLRYGGLPLRSNPGARFWPPLDRYPVPARRSSRLMQNPCVKSGNKYGRPARSPSTYAARHVSNPDLDQEGLHPGLLSRRGVSLSTLGPASEIRHLHRISFKRRHLPHHQCTQDAAISALPQECVSRIGPSKHRKLLAMCRRLHGGYVCQFTHRPSLVLECRTCGCASFTRQYISEAFPGVIVLASRSFISSMSYPVYISQEYQASRPYQQLPDVAQQQYPVYVSSQYPQQQMPQRMPQLMDYYHNGPAPASLGLLATPQDYLPPNQSAKLQQNLQVYPQAQGYPYSTLAMPMQPTQVTRRLPAYPQYPLSPASLHSEQKPLESERDPQINFSSLVGYTVLPMAKRRRRTDTKAVSADPQACKHTCATCGKLFQKPYNLKLHLKTHSTDRPFKCSQCPKTFARLHDRKRHELLHGGVKNFKCEGFLKNGTTKWGCSKKFARADALARHFRTETGWLCIKPLMDEAKDVDNGKLHAEHPSYFQHQIALPPLRQF